MSTGTPALAPSTHRLRLGVIGLLLAGLGLVATAQAQTTAAPAALGEHVKADVQRHRAMALAHETAARCLESGKPEAQCAKELQASCKGLAIGKYCGMKHEH